MRVCVLALAALLPVTSLFGADPDKAPQEKSASAPIDFAHQVLPILKANCAKCHTNGTYKASMSMDTREALLESEAIVPGHADKSKLIKRVSTDDIFTRMPPAKEGEPLSEEQIAILRRWVNAGAPWTDGFTFKTTTTVRPLAIQEVKIPPATEESGNHPIDRLLTAYAAEHKIELAPLANDATFLRRLYLDLIGLLPSPEEIESYKKDKHPDKADRAVALLLQRDRDYAAHWLTFWNDLLRNDYAGTGYIDGGRKQITKWLHEALRENMHYDEFVRQLVNPSNASEGFANGIVWRGKINASQVPQLQFSQNVAQIFLGINLKCASCHDSFISDWKLADAYGLAAVVSKKPLELHRCDVPQGVMATPKFLFPQVGQIDPNAPIAERKEQLAQLMTDPDNGRLARTIVNRLWQRMMGRALVEPVDHMAGPAWSPKLLEYLAGYLVENDYNLQKLLAHIATSRAYRRQAVEWKVAPDESDFVFRGPLVKRMTAEEFLDALWTITDTGPQKPVADLPLAMLSDGHWGPKVRAAFVTAGPLMRSLGRPPREHVVTTRPDRLTMLQALDLSNGPELATMLDAGAKNLAKQYKDRPPEVIIEHLFLEALSRQPTDEERAVARHLLGESITEKGIADLLWAVVMLPEFQHIR